MSLTSPTRGSTRSTCTPSPGRVAPGAPVPRTLGTEGAGTVDGRPVLARGHGIGTARDGLWATAAVVPYAALIDVPDGVALEQAAAMGVAGVTAWRRHRLRLRRAAGIGRDRAGQDRGCAAGAGGPLTLASARDRSTRAPEAGTIAADVSEFARPARQIAGRMASRWLPTTDCLPVPYPGAAPYPRSA